MWRFLLFFRGHIHSFFSFSFSVKWQAVASGRCCNGITADKTKNKDKSCLMLNVIRKQQNSSEKQIKENVYMDLVA